MTFQRLRTSAWSWEESHSRMSERRGCRPLCEQAPRKIQRPAGRRCPQILQFDFGETNKQLFLWQYKRIGSYFEGLELIFRSSLEAQRLEILQAVKEQVARRNCHGPIPIRSAGSDGDARALREATV